MLTVIIFVLLLFVYALLSQRIEQTPVTAPMVFTALGMAMSPAWVHIAGAGVTANVFLRVAELGLVLLLFTDASRTDLKVLRSIETLPGRLLSIGMLLTILLGAIAAHLVFPRLSLWETGILAAILAPTDAGLGQVVVSSPRVPMRIRQALNVEAGLNDGLSVPFLLFFMAFAAARTEGSAASLLQFIGEQLGLGVVVGAAIGLIGGWLLRFATRRGYIADSFRQIAVVTLPLMCLLLAEMVDASMFIAAFVAGLAVQIPFPEAGKHSVDFAEEWGQMFNLTVFFLFGMLVVRDWPQFTVGCWVYALLSLTVVRMLPVTVSLLGTGLGASSVLFMGWFGPRGLASIVLGMVYLEQELHLPGEPAIRLAVMGTVVLSIFVHGASALPGISIYARKVRALEASAPERQDDRGSQSQAAGQ
ncbi:MAG TPA: cation:proton antiporter [Candidatus Binatia bacterium]|nr:cation:proton antiporter [Candidatus Binatia bacterium]